MTRSICTTDLRDVHAVSPVCVAWRQPWADEEAARLLSLVAAQTGVDVPMFGHPSRCRAPIAHARQLAMYLMHTLLGRTMSDVGRYFGRDRTTVAHACGRIEDLRDDPVFDAEVTALEEALQPDVPGGECQDFEAMHAWH